MRDYAVNYKCWRNQSANKGRCSHTVYREITTEGNTGSQTEGLYCGLSCAKLRLCLIFT